MKRWKYNRIVLYNNGYDESIPTNLTLLDIDAEGYLIYNDENGNVVKARYDTTGATSIDISPAVSAATIATGATFELQIFDEDLVDVTSECTFVSSDTAVATVNVDGLIRGISTGNSRIIISYVDEEVSTTTFYITVS